MLGNGISGLHLCVQVLHIYKIHVTPIKEEVRTVRVVGGEAAVEMIQIQYS